MLSQNLLNLVDAAMVGRLGVSEQAAVGISGILAWVMTALLQGYSPAVQTITARRMGERAEHRLHESLVNALYLILVVGLPMTALLTFFTPELAAFMSDDPGVRTAAEAYLGIRLLTIVLVGSNFCFRGYFTAIHRAALFTKVIVAMHVLNVALNYGLIFGNWGMPEMGVAGAALGTAIATGTGTLTLALFTFRLRYPGFSIDPRSLSWRTLKVLLGLAIPSCLQSLSLATGYFAFFPHLRDDFQRGLGCHLCADQLQSCLFVRVYLSWIGHTESCQSSTWGKK